MWLIVNAGSSSLKLAIFDGTEAVAKASVSEIGADGHAAALTQGLNEAGVPLSRITAVAHRVVHGGAHLTAACRVTPAVLARIERVHPKLFARITTTSSSPSSGEMPVRSRT